MKKKTQHWYLFALDLLIERFTVLTVVLTVVLTIFYICTFTHAHTCMYVYIYTRVCAYTDTHMRTYTHTYIRVHLLVHTGNRASGPTEGDDGDGSQEDPSQAKKKAIKKKKKVIETDLRRINISDVEQSYEVSRLYLPGNIEFSSEHVIAILTLSVPCVGTVFLWLPPQIQVEINVVERSSRPMLSEVYNMVLC